MINNTALIYERGCDANRRKNALKYEKKRNRIKRFVFRNVFILIPYQVYKVSEEK